MAKKICDVKEVLNSVYLLTFDNQFMLTTTLIRFQEYYESPKFKGKIFDIEDYQDWYYSKNKKFDYYENVVGFNFPSRCARVFIANDKLRKKEKKFIKHFKESTGKNFDEDFYIIGVYKGEKGDITETKSALKHELAHGLFSINKEYREGVLEILHEYKEEVKPIYRMLKHSGYHQDLFEDEAHAYLMENDSDLRSIFKNNLTPKKIKWGGSLKKIDKPRNRLRKLFHKYIKIEEKNV